MGRPDQRPAARSRRRILRQQRQTDEQGQRTVLRRGAVVEQLSRAESRQSPIPNWPRKWCGCSTKKGSTSRPRRCRCCRSWSPPSPRAPPCSATLAEYAYKAHNDRQGDLAAAKAVSLAPASERARLKKELAELKKSAASNTSLDGHHHRAATPGQLRPAPPRPANLATPRSPSAARPQSQPEGQGRDRKQQKEVATRSAGGAFWATAWMLTPSGSAALG